MQIIYVARGIESIRANLGRSLTKDEGVIVSTVNAVERIQFMEENDEQRQG